jgi:Lrp/AsnC family leucine-responsive transcriptional regulator
VDEIDRQLLQELRSNARISHARLGDLVRLSRNAVRQRIERLERDGDILGYTIVEGSPAPPSVTAIFLVSRHDRVRGIDVIATLQGIPEIVQCDVVSGELDLVIRVEAATPQRIQEIWREVADEPGVRDITTAMSLTSVVDRRR